MKHQPKNKSEKQKRQDRQRRRHTIHVVNGRPAYVPDIPGLDPTNIPFLGQEMICIMCGRQQRSDPHIESQWRCLVSGRISTRRRRQRRFHGCLHQDFDQDSFTWREPWPEEELNRLAV